MTEFRAPRVELLGAQHDRSRFSCGIAALDDYFQNQAGQDTRRSVTRVCIAVDDHTGAIVGFYTLSATSIAWLDISEHLARKLSRYPIPAALIGRLAVDRRFHQPTSGNIFSSMVDNIIEPIAAVAKLYGRKALVSSHSRLAEQCSAQADAMQPGPERDALIAKMRQYRSYAKMENWIASKELQRPVS